jgi:hypothetical protein
MCEAATNAMKDTPSINAQVGLLSVEAVVQMAVCSIGLCSPLDRHIHDHPEFLSQALVVEQLMEIRAALDEITGGVDVFGLSCPVKVEG